MIIFPSPDVPQFTDTIVSIDGLLFGLDIEGVMWIFTDLKGWTLGGGVETNFTPRPGQHGEFDGQAYRRRRVIELSGVCLADSAALAELAADALGALLADGSSGSFTVQNSRRSLSATVRLSDEPLDSRLDDLSFTWSLQFTAPDHRKYGEPQSVPTSLPGGGAGLSFPVGAAFDFGAPGSTGRIVLTNDGTADTEPTFDVNGPLAVGFQVSEVETGRRLRYESALSGAVMLDCLEGTATQDGQDRTGLLTVDEFFTIPPKQSRTYQLSTLGTETFTSPAGMTGTASPAYH